MVRALKTTVEILLGGRVEIESPDLPEGGQVEVIILLPDEGSPSRRIEGAFADQAELLDVVVEEAIADREEP